MEIQFAGLLQSLLITIIQLASEFTLVQSQSRVRDPIVAIAEEELRGIPGDAKVILLADRMAN